MPLDNLVQGFVRDTAERARSLVGSVVSRVSDKYDPRSGPLAALSQNPLAISSTMQYPINLGSGPNISYIKFSILESVAVEGQSSAAFAGNANRTKRNSSVESIVNNTITAASGLIATGAKQLGIEADAAQAGRFLSDLGINPGQFTTQRRVKKTGKVIALYMPHTMVFTQTNSYNDFSYTQSMGSILLAAQGLDAAVKKDFTGAGSAAAEAIGRAALGEEGLRAALYGFTGKALNPQIEVIYQETPLRTFQFEFVLAARSIAEGEQIKRIVDSFRAAAAPSFDNTEGVAGRFLIPPDEFDIEFSFAGKEMKTVPKISTCVLTNFVTDLASSGQFTTFSNGEPMSIRMTLEFKEVEIITKQKIQKGF